MNKWLISDRGRPIVKGGRAALNSEDCNVECCDETEACFIEVTPCSDDNCFQADAQKRYFVECSTAQLVWDANHGDGTIFSNPSNLEAGLLCFILPDEGTTGETGVELDELPENGILLQIENQFEPGIFTACENCCQGGLCDCPTSLSFDANTSYSCEPTATGGSVGCTNSESYSGVATADLIFTYCLTPGPPGDVPGWRGFGPAGGTQEVVIICCEWAGQRYWRGAASVRTHPDWGTPGADCGDALCPPGEDVGPFNAISGDGCSGCVSHTIEGSSPDASWSLSATLCWS